MALPARSSSARRPASSSTGCDRCAAACSAGGSSRSPRGDRATVLSTLEQADSISQVTIGPVMGVIGNTAGIPAALIDAAALLAPSALAGACAGVPRGGHGAVRDPRRSRGDRRSWAGPPDRVLGGERVASATVAALRRPRRQPSRPARRWGTAPRGVRARAVRQPGRRRRRWTTSTTAGLDESRRSSPRCGRAAVDRGRLVVPAPAARAPRPSRLRDVVVPQRLRDGRSTRTVPPRTPTMRRPRGRRRHARRVLELFAVWQRDHDGRRADGQRRVRPRRARPRRRHGLSSPRSTGPLGCGSLVRDAGIGWLGGAATAPGGPPARRPDDVAAPPHGRPRRDGCDIVGRHGPPARGLRREPVPARVHAGLRPGGDDAAMSSVMAWPARLPLPSPLLPSRPTSRRSSPPRRPWPGSDFTFAVRYDPGSRGAATSGDWTTTATAATSPTTYSCRGTLLPPTSTACFVGRTSIRHHLDDFLSQRAGTRVRRPARPPPTLVRHRDPPPEPRHRPRRSAPTGCLSRATTTTSAGGGDRALWRVLDAPSSSRRGVLIRRYWID